MRAAAGILVVAALVLSSGAGYACSSITIPPVAPPPHVVAFTGIVEAHISADIPLDASFSAPGLLVSVADGVVRAESGDRLRVFPLGTGLDCQPVSRDQDDVVREYPLGARVSVVGWTVEDHPELILTASDDFGHVARAPEDPPETLNGFLDFRDFSELAESHPPGRFSREVAWHDAHLRWYEDFAYLRCLVALESALSLNERVSLLTNMAYYSGFDRLSEKFADQRYRDLLSLQPIARKDRKRLRQAFRDATQQAN